MINTNEILSRIRRLREMKKLKQDDIAKHLGIDRTTYLRKEKGQIPLTTEELLLIADFLDEAPAGFLTKHAFTLPASDEGDLDENANLILAIYRLLNTEERRDLLFTLRLILKGVENKSARKLLKEIK